MVWNKAPWTEEARDIIENLKDASFKSKTILLLRHSQRYEPSFDDENQYMELTAQGRSIARLLGTKLPKDRTIRLFHSPVNRCRETAEEIHAGVKEVGGKSIFKGECSVVWGIGINNQFFMSELKRLPQIEVFFRWASGFYPLDKFPSLLSYCQRGAEIIWNQLELAPENGIDIYISHDWHTNAFRYGWFGLPPKDKLIDYLGGFAFSFNNEDHILLLDYGEIKVLEVPHWWEKKKLNKK
ncbi:MAG: histidine phosphatase family protein [Promethearchaeota archaeon]